MCIQGSLKFAYHFVRSVWMTWFIAVFLFGGFANVAQAQPAPAGAIIENQARASYFNERLGIYEAISSNIVITVVNTVPAIEVEEDQVAYLTSDTLGEFGFTARNTGNTLITPSLSLVQQTSDNFDLDAVELYLDANGNGIVDPGDTPLGSGSLPTLEIGEEIGVIVLYRTPVQLSEADEAQLLLTAEDASAGVSDSATGTVIIATTGLALQKEVSLALAEPNDTLRYTLRLRNRGSNDVAGYDTIDGTPIMIDGLQIDSGILVRDAVPDNTQFIGFVSHNQTQSFEALYHVVGASATDQDYFTSLPAGTSLSDVDAVAFFRPGDYPASFSSDFIFEVRVGEYVADSYIPNVAETWQQAGEDIQNIDSNPVRTQIEGVPGILEYTDPSGNVITRTGLDTNVQLRLSASGCNLDGSAVETVSINIATLPEGDLETALATETGPNTGVFTTANIPVQKDLPVVQQNGVITGDRATQAPASVVCAGKTLTADLTINPGGVVFNSASNNPVLGAEVVLYDNFGTELQRVTSDEDGFYVFDGALSGVYQIEVIPPEDSDVVFPSQRLLFPGWGRNIHPEASYGNPFDISADLASPFFGIDIPLDPDAANGLLLEKDVEPDVASPGDFVVYTLTLENRLDLAIANTFIYDTLPDGLSYVEGSVRVNGEPVTVTGDQSLEIQIGDVLRLETLEITYAAIVDPLAEGRLVNIAYAEGQYYGDGLVRSNDARATLRVARDRGVFNDGGVVLGTVYVDFNRNGIQDEFIHPNSQGVLSTQGKGEISEGKWSPPPERQSLPTGPIMEPGIPGVKIYFETGAHVVTDLDGRYSMPGLTPRTHVMAVSEATLPASVKLMSTTTRDAKQPRSRLIRVLPGQVVGEYFATVPHDYTLVAAVLQELEERSERLRERGADISARMPTASGTGAPQTTDYLTNRGNRRDAAYATDTGILIAPDGVGGNYTLPADEAIAMALVDVARTRNLETQIQQMSPALAFLDLSSDDTLNDDVVTIRVKGPVAGSLGLVVNGEEIGAERISQRVAYSTGGVQAVEFVAIRLRPGTNEIELVYRDPFGNARERRAITVDAPGASATIKLIAPPTAYADPSSPIPVLVRVTDAAGIPTGVSMDVTLESSNGSKWGARDLRPSEPGLQVFIDNGEALIDYYPPEVPGTHTIRVRNGLGRFTRDIVLEPNTGDEIIVGFIEGVIGIDERDIETDDLVGYDETITGINGGLYLRGRILGEAILTLRYDSDKDSKERLFRDVDPQAYYPVYGDASDRGYDAQSNSQLYVRIDHGTNYILYGDITMGSQADAFQLGGYSRNLTGLHGHYEQGPVRVDIMAGLTEQTQLVREFRAEGISGPYDLDLGDYLDGSERVEIVTRDRRQTATIISTQTLQRYIDYRLDFFNDSIIFDVPVPATDEDGNPNFIRVTYETNDGAGEDYWIYSGEVSYDISETLSVGYREIHSDAEDTYEDRRMLRAGYVTSRIGEHSRLEFEFAQSRDNLDETGLATRLAYEYARNDVNLSFSYGQTEENFLDQGSTMSAGREETSLEASWLVRPDVNVQTGLFYDHNMVSGDERYAAEALLDYRLSDELILSSGLRMLQRYPGDNTSDQNVTSTVIGATWTPESKPGLSLTGELEFELGDPKNYRAKFSASQKVNDKLRVYSELDYASDEAEFLDFSSATGATASMKAGFEYRFNDRILAFSDIQSGARTGISTGISGEWALDEIVWGRWFPGDENAILYARAEHFQPYDVADVLGLPFGDNASNDEAQTSFAVGSFGEYNDGQGAVRLDTEGSLYEDGYSTYARQYWAEGYGSWTWAIENRLAYANRDEDERLRNHLRFGGAYRDPAEQLDVLSYAGYRVDDDPAASLDSQTAYWSTGGSWAIDANSRMTFKQAGQYVKRDVSGADEESFLTYGQLGLDHDFTISDGFDGRIGAHVGAFHDVLNNETTAAYGVELGYVPTDNIMLSAGYNWSDVNAAQISEIYSTGLYLKFSVILDNSLWGIFDRAR